MQGEECNWGMIGGVNIHDPETFQEYREYATKINGNVAPNDTFGGLIVSPDGEESGNQGKSTKSDDDEGGARGCATAGLAGVVALAAFAAGIV